MREGIRLVVPEGGDGIRLDRFLRDAIHDAQARSIRRAFETGEVSVDGRPAPKGLSLRSGQRVCVGRLYGAEDWLPVPGDLPGASVAYEDGLVTVLEKPWGIQTEPIRPEEAGTLAGYYAWRFPRSPVSPDRALLSRLDRETSGLVLAALDPDALRFLLRERAEGRIGKSYVCRVAGTIPSGRVLRSRIETRGGGRVRVLPGRTEPDPLYWTRIVPLEESGGETLVRAEIGKGKRHQIRAHLAAEGHPILGDAVYGGEVPGHPARLLLHAAEIRFRHPGTGETVTVRSAVPVEFGG